MTICNLWIGAFGDKDKWRLMIPPPFYPDWFCRLAVKIIDESWGIGVDNIDATNCKDIYIHVKDYIANSS